MERASACLVERYAEVGARLVGMRLWVMLMVPTLPMLVAVAVVIRVIWAVPTFGGLGVFVLVGFRRLRHWVTPSCGAAGWLATAAGQCVY